MPVIFASQLADILAAADIEEVQLGTHPPRPTTVTAYDALTDLGTDEAPEFDILDATASVGYVQAEAQAVIDKLDALIAALQTAGVIAASGS